jgi:hypothetical protein
MFLSAVYSLHMKAKYVIYHKKCWLVMLQKLHIEGEHYEQPI